MASEHSGRATCNQARLNGERLRSGHYPKPAGVNSQGSGPHRRIEVFLGLRSTGPPPAPMLWAA
jgi:hypothetical protein